MDQLKIAFYIGKSRENPSLRFWDKVVCFFDGSKYSHAELVLREFDDGTCLCASSSVRDGGVRYKRMALHMEHWDLVNIYGDRAEAIRWMNRRQGRRYDWIGLIRTRFGWIPDNQLKYFCTESVASMLGLEDAASYGPKKLYHTAVSYLSLPLLDALTDPELAITEAH